MKIIITGGAGFIGSNLVKAILKNTDHKVINIDCLTYAGNLLSVEEVSSHQNYEFSNIDITNKEQLKKIFEETQPDAVMHLAAESHVDRSIINPKNFIDTNIIGTFNLLDVTHDYLESKSQEISKNFKFHHISTDEVFGDLETNESPFTEESSYKPSSPYAASKAASDHLVRAWGRTFKLPIVSTNCSNNFGPYQYPEKLIPTIILNALNGKKIPIYGTGKQIRDWLYVEDHVNGLITVMEKGDIGETYMIGGNNELTNIYVAESICSIMDKLIISKPNTIDSFSELITHVADRKGHDIRYAVNCSKISRDLGWAPQYTFELAIERTIKWYIENSSWCNSVSK